MIDNLRPMQPHEYTVIYPNPKRKEMWVGDTYKVQVMDEAHGIRRLNIERLDGRDGISWDTLQEIKDALGYADRDAIEVYPRTQDILYVVNARHLWVLPEPLPYIWRVNNDPARFSQDYITKNIKAAQRGQAPTG